MHGECEFVGKLLEDVHMRKSVLATLLILTMVPVGFTQEFAGAPANSPRNESLEAKVDQLFAQWDRPDAPGCALAVIEDGQLIYKRGYGMANLEHDIPITPASIFHVASVSKQFTAFAILLLTQEGKLSLDDNVRKYVPEVPDFGLPITIRHLLQHTSGLRDNFFPLGLAGWRPDDLMTEGDILNFVASQKDLDFKPGDDVSYSNTGYVLLAVIVKRITGQSLREFAEANIFKPLGMTHTHFHDDHTMVVKNRTSAYSPRNDGGFQVSIPVFDYIGATSLFTTVEDLAKWANNLYDGRVGGKAVIEQMLAPGTLNNGERFDYGLGVQLGEYRGLKTVGHGGVDAGYRARLEQFSDQRFSVAILCNLSTILPVRLARQIADIYLEEHLAKEGERSPDTMPSEDDRAGKTGIYWNTITEEVRRLYMKDGKLMVAGPEEELVPLGKNRFRAVGSGNEFIFPPVRGGEQIQLQEIPLQPISTPIAYERIRVLVPSPDQLAEYTGAYYSQELQARVTIALRDGKLTLQGRKLPDRFLDPMFDDAFLIDQQRYFIRFTRAPQNRVSGLTLSAGRVRRLRFVKEAN